MTHASLEAYDTERTRRAEILAPMKARLAELGLRWGDARRWALTEMAEGRRPAWRPADAPVQTPNPDILGPYLEQLPGKT